MTNPTPHEGELILYRTADNAVRVEVLYESETFWLDQRRMAELFGVDLRTVNEHLRNIYDTGELSEGATLRKIRIVRTEGTREVARDISFYNLDAIISVGYRVNSSQATQFRIWATKTLREFIVLQPWTAVRCMKCVTPRRPPSSKPPSPRARARSRIDEGLMIVCSDHADLRRGVT